MQLTDTFCYILITISVTATCVQSENQSQDLSERSHGRRIAKREAAIIIDNFPAETMVSKKPKVIYRRLSKQRYRAPKPRYGPPRSKYGPPKSTRKPNKKYKIKKVNPKFGPPSNKKRSPKPRYVRPRSPHPRSKAKYGLSKKRPQPPKQTHVETNSYQSPIKEPAGFAEPPPNYQPPNDNYGEPPVDSYGAPLKNFKDSYQTTEDLEPPNYESPDKQNTGNDYSNWPDLAQPDNNYGYSNRYQTIIKPGSLSVFDNEAYGDEPNLNSYSDVYKFNDQKQPYVQFQKQRPDFLGDFHKLVNKPWKAPVNKVKEEKILVGGQYAEPPARYVPKFQPSAPMYLEDEESFNPAISYTDTEASVSPYVNYKNSNMAFSPQNLNDAFSIVDKRR